MSTVRTLLTCAACLGAAVAADALQIQSVSGRPDRISGGDVLLRITAPPRLPLSRITVKRNGRDITSAFRPETGAQSLLGLVRGLRLGHNLIEAFDGGEAPDAQLSIVNFDAAGPVFSGPRESPFICQTEKFKLPDGSLLGPALDNDCTIKTVVQYVYKENGETAWKPFPVNGPRPEEIAVTTTSAGQKVPYIVRVETGTRNRSLYQTAVLHDPAEPPPTPFAPPKSWNRRLLYTFGGGCTGGWFRQGAGLPTVLNDEVVGRGYAEAAASLNVFGNNCNDVLAAETMMLVKETFVEAYGPPAFTFGRGGSGGSYQQLQIADGYPGLLDGIIPSATFPDVLETTQFLVDAQLLHNYFNRGGASLSDAQKMAVSGVGTLKNVTGISAGAGRINPTTFCPAELPVELRYHPVQNRSGARCDIFDHTVNVYGRDPLTGFARRAIDNTGVQYGLKALEQGVLSMDEFLDLNEQIGGYDADGNPVPARSIGDPLALRAAYQTGRVTHGGMGLSRVPIIDVRSYTDLTEKGDVHQKYHSFALRARLRAANGTINNTVMLLGTGAGYRKLHSEAILRMDAWLTALQKDTSADPPLTRIARAKPAELVDGCITPSGDRVNEPQRPTGGTCNTHFPTFSSPRMMAGGPLTNNVLKCQLRPLQFTDYPGEISASDKQRLRTIFPDGVCDWKKPGVEQQRQIGTWLQY